MSNWSLYVRKLAAKSGVSLDEAERFTQERYIEESERAAMMGGRYTQEQVERADYERDQQKDG